MGHPIFYKRVSWKNPEEARSATFSEANIVVPVGLIVLVKRS